MLVVSFFQVSVCHAGNCRSTGKQDLYYFQFRHVAVMSTAGMMAGANLLNTLTVKELFGEVQRLNKKINRESFVMPA